MRVLRLSLAAVALLAVLSVEVAAQGVGVSIDVEPVSPKRVRLGGQALLSYAVKFLCGTIPHSDADPQQPPPGAPLVPGTYLTAVNIHNPQGKEVRFRKKAVIANPQGQPRGRIGQLVDESLKPDEALEVDCDNIKQLLGAPTAGFMKGFVVILSPVELDVVGVYTLKNVVDTRQVVSQEARPAREGVLFSAF
jgi:hypothetical protein